MNWKDPVLAARLKKLWSEGHSCGVIARMIGGVTRNAVIGAVSRAGLPGRATTSRTKHPTRKRQLSREGANARPNAGEHPWRSTPKPLSPAAQALKSIRKDGLPLPPPADTDIARIALIDLERHHCRWICSDADHPLYDKRYCGSKIVPGTSYCRDHLVRAHATKGWSPHLPAIAGKPVVIEKIEELQVA